MLRTLFLLAPLFWFTFPASAAPPPERFAVILEDPPLAAAMVASKEGVRGAQADQRQRIEAAQDRVRRALEERRIQITAATRVLLNAVYVAASREQAEELRALPGVRRVVRLLPMRRSSSRGLDLVRAREAWAALGGEVSAGAGIRIGVIDTGIDTGHAAFQDPALQPPAGFPKCQPADCAFTNNKVIVARSYVHILALAGADAVSRPDDLSARDRVGHGTAVAAIAAGRSVGGPAGPIAGMAPKAFLGNYKVFGSPGVNDFTFGDATIRALEDALADGMQVVTISHGSPAIYGPLDESCGGGNALCDPVAEAVEWAVEMGLVVVAAAGNDGDRGIYFPSYTSVESPATAPGAIAVGASTNDHAFFATVRVAGDDVPAGIRTIDALFGDGPQLSAPLTAPLRDVAALGTDGLACTPLPAGSLNGAVALVRRGECDFATKAIMAQRAGAVAVVLYQSEGLNGLFHPRGLAATGIPLAFIGSTAGVALRNFLGAAPDRPVTLDPALRQVDATANIVADFSARGPAIGTDQIKPELVAVGTNLYTATQTYDPNADLYDPSGFLALQGTSFAVGQVAGAAALVLQARPGFRPGEVKSALVNTASTDVDEYFGDVRDRAEVAAAGAGKLNVASAIQARVVVEPATLSLGVLTVAGSATIVPTGVREASPVPVTRQLRFTNRGSSAVQLVLTDSPGRVFSGSRNVDLAPGESRSMAFTVQNLPSPGVYQGEILVAGAGVPMIIPYLYLVSDNVPGNMFALGGDEFVGFPNEFLPHLLIAKVTDRYGVPLQGVPVRFRPGVGGGAIGGADAATDVFGIAAAEAVLGPQLGPQGFTIDAGLEYVLPFDGTSRLAPTINTGGVVNAGSGLIGQGLAPGSYLSIYGRALADLALLFRTPYLPLSLGGVSVSFDVPERGLGLPGRIHFTSESQVNVQIPWELEGLNSARMKVSIGNLSSAVYTLPLATASPAFFLVTDPTNSTQIIAALDAENRLITAQNPARRGAVVQLFGNGLGPVSDRPATGEPTPGSPLRVTSTSPTVRIGGREARVDFSGLTPFSIGLYQLNVAIPADIPAGVAEVTISIHGQVSAVARIPIG
jgi:minor extracellular serine protease Vpr